MKQGVGTRKVYSERKREGERWWAQEQQQIGAKKLLGWWPFTRPSEVCVSTQIGLTLSSGPFVLDRMSVCVRVRVLVHLYVISHFECCFLRCFLIWVFTIFLAEEWEVAMGARLGMITEACKCDFLVFRHEKQTVKNPSYNFEILTLNKFCVNSGSKSVFLQWTDENLWWVLMILKIDHGPLFDWINFCKIDFEVTWLMFWSFYFYSKSMLVLKVSA